jgi:hypothetical protein
VLPRGERRLSLLCYLFGQRIGISRQRLRVAPVASTFGVVKVRLLATRYTHVTSEEKQKSIGLVTVVVGWSVGPAPGLGGWHG